MALPMRMAPIFSRRTETPTEAICECGGVAGLGLAGQDGSGRVAWRVTLEAIGPSRRCLPVELSTLGIAAGAVRPTSVT